MIVICDLRFTIKTNKGGDKLYFNKFIYAKNFDGKCLINCKYELILRNSGC